MLENRRWIYISHGAATGRSRLSKKDCLTATRASRSEWSVRQCDVLIHRDPHRWSSIPSFLVIKGSSDPKVKDVDVSGTRVDGKD